MTSDSWPSLAELEANVYNKSHSPFWLRRCMVMETWKSMDVFRGKIDSGDQLSRTVSMAVNVRVSVSVVTSTWYAFSMGTLSECVCEGEGRRERERERERES